MKKTILTLSALAFIGAVAFTSCKKDSDSTTTPTPTPTPSLYERVGGTTLVADPHDNTGATKIEKGKLTLRTVVDTAIYIIAADPKMTPFFATLLDEHSHGNDANVTLLSGNLTDFLAKNTGSKTIAYGGLDMTTAHNPLKHSRTGQGVAQADFDSFIGDVAKSLNKNGVATGTSLYNDLAAALYSFENPVVQGGVYARLGGSKMVTDPKGGMIEQGKLTVRCVVDSAIYVIAGDSKMAPFFPTLLAEVGAGNTTGFTALSNNLTTFISSATGSTTANYTGLSMKAAHNHATNPRMGSATAGQQATSADFDAFLGDVGKSLNKNGVPTDTKGIYGDLVNVLLTVKSDVVQK